MTILFFYDGVANGARAYPGALETIRRFAARAHCAVDNPLTPPNLDVLGGIEGDETTVISYPNYDSGVGVELWTLVGGPHVPFPWVSSAIDGMVDWMIGHPRFVGFP